MPFRESLQIQRVCFTPCAPQDQIVPAEYGTLLKRGGIDPSLYKPSALTRRASACLRKLGAGTIGQAVEAVEKRADLAREVPEIVLLGVSGFFRDPEVWSFFEERNLGYLLCQDHLPRVLSVGCSDGQELYSMAMVLAEAGALGDGCLLGIDCRERAITNARRGVYPAENLAQVLPFRRRHFERNSGGVRVNAVLRGAVRWRVQSAAELKPGEFWDVILFRNLAIYLSEKCLAALWSVLIRQINPGGFLITGKAERPPPGLGLDRVHPCIYRKRLDRASHDH